MDPVLIGRVGGGQSGKRSEPNKKAGITPAFLMSLLATISS